MSLSLSDFPDYFAEVNGGNRPFDWQMRLLDCISAGGVWPDRIAAPTGSGKSSVVEIHVFANALFAAGAIARVPRRLAVVVNRRALVDNQSTRASDLQNLLERSRDGVLGKVGAALRTLRSPRAEPERLPPFDVAEIRGGISPSSGWRDDPCACLVISATPDMWGSRLLFGGYGASRNARPREAGLLAYDSVLVLDEAHLNRQLLHTARRLAPLESAASRSIGVAPLQVVETTATPSRIGSQKGGPIEVGVVESDILDASTPAAKALAGRLSTPKPVRRIPLENWPIPKSGPAHRDALQLLSVEALRLHREFGTAGRSGRTIGCIMNTVAMAVDLAAKLEHEGLTVRLFVGRMRPHDVAELRNQHPGLLRVEGDPSIDVLVSTQTLEVGVDVDLAALITELAPGSAVAQRAGRVNRLGNQAETEILVIGPDDAGRLVEQVGPYRREDLAAAWDWLETREVANAGLSPWSLVSAPPPQESLHRILLQRPELSDAWSWSRTSDEMFAEPDLALWLRDDLEADRASAGLVVRDHLPEDEPQALSLLNAMVPRAHEVFPVPLHDLRQVLVGILDIEANVDTDDGPDPAGIDRRRRAFIYRDGEVVVCLGQSAFRPGDVVIVDSVHPVCRANVVGPVPTDRALDIYGARPDGNPVLLVIPHSRCEDDIGIRLLARVGEILGEELAEIDIRNGLIADALAETGRRANNAEPYATAVRLLRAVPAAAEIIIGLGEDGDVPPWMIVAGTAFASRDEESRQTWTSNREAVTLESHSRAVAERALDLGRALGLPDDVCAALELAGLHHDDGKDDPRFQRMLGAQTGQALAKSHRRSPHQMRIASATSGLPHRWRHEQLSAAVAGAALGSSPDRDLVLRLVGTSHGRGRSGFPHDSCELLTGEELDSVRSCAQELFDEGQWDSLIDSTHLDWGTWGSAYLEAVIRAADGQISREGR